MNKGSKNVEIESQNAPPRKSEQFGRPAHLDVEKELDTGCVRGWGMTICDKSVVHEPETEMGYLTKPDDSENSQEGDFKRRSSGKCVLERQVERDPAKGLPVSVPATRVNLGQVQLTAKAEPPASR